MNVALWIVQALLALVFVMAGGMKLMRSKEEVRDSMAWVDDFSQTQLRLIGIAEVLGALGLILPALTGILPWLSPIAGAGLALVMVGAIVTHVRRSETSMAAMNVVLLLLALFVAYGRFVLAPL